MHLPTYLRCGILACIDSKRLGSDSMREEMAGEEENRKRKVDEAVEGESSRQSLKTFNNNDLSVDSYARARRAFNDAIFVPAEFKCPLSKATMSDPIDLSSGQTVDRTAFLEKSSILQDNDIGQVTGINNPSSATMTHNGVLRTRIKQWHEDKRKAELRFQLKIMSLSLDFQVASARELSMMVVDTPPYAKAFADLGPSAIIELFRPLMPNDLPTDSSLQEDILLIAVSLCKHHPPNMELLGHQPFVIDIILSSLICGSLLAKSFAANLLSQITAVPSCRAALARSGIILHLAEIVKGDRAFLIDSAINALCKLCNEWKYLQQVIGSDIIKSILDRLHQIHFSSNFSDFLYKISLEDAGWRQLAASQKMHSLLLDTLRKTSSPEMKETCLVILSRILAISDDALVTTFEHEMKYHVISQVVETETETEDETETTPRAKETAKETARNILKTLEETTSYRAALLNT